MFDVRRRGAGIGETATLHDAEARTSASIATGYGCNCFSFRARHRGAETELLYAEAGFPHQDMKGTRNGIPILAPFPNRIAGGKFAWAGKDYSLPATDGMGNAIHGFAWDSAWRIVDTSTAGNAASCTAEFVLSRDRPEKLAWWPGDFRLTLEYRLAGNTLALAAEVENLADNDIPFGFGTHPYFKVPLAPESQRGDCVVQLPADRAVELIGCIPTGRVAEPWASQDLRAGRPLSAGPLDDAYADLRPAADGRFRSWVADPAAGLRIVQTWDGALPYAVVFTPPHGHAACVEPYTCVTNAVNMATLAGRDPGLWSLAPGERRKWRIEIAAEPL